MTWQTTVVEAYPKSICCAVIKVLFDGAMRARRSFERYLSPNDKETSDG